MNEKEDLVKAKFELDIDQFKSALRDVMQEVDETKNASKKINKGMADEAEKTSKSMFSSFKDTYSKIQKGFFEAFLVQMMLKQIGTLITGLSNLAKEADKVKMAMTGLNSIAESFGQDGGIAQKNAKRLVEMSGGMVKLEQAAQGYKMLLASGFDVDEAMNLSKAMLEIGAFNNITGDLGQAFVDASKGIKTGSVELTENIGLVERLSSVFKKAGVSIENGIDITNNAAQRQALYNSVLKQSEGFVGDLAEVQETYTGKIAKTGLEFKKFMENLGRIFQPIIKLGSEILANIIKPFNMLFESNVMQNYSNDLFNVIKRYEELSKVTKPTTEQQAELQRLMTELNILAPNSVTNYELMGREQVNLAEATKQLVEMKRLELEVDKTKFEMDSVKLKKQKDEAQEKLDLAKSKRPKQKEFVEEAHRDVLTVEKDYKDRIKSLNEDLERLSLKPQTAVIKKSIKETKDSIDFLNARWKEGSYYKYILDKDLQSRMKTSFGDGAEGVKSFLEEYKNMNSQRMGLDLQYEQKVILPLQENLLSLSEAYNIADTSAKNASLTLGKLQAGDTNIKSYEDIVFGKKNTVKPVDEKKNEYKAGEASDDFLKQQELSYEQSKTDINTKRLAFEKKEIDKYELAIAEAEFKSATNVYNKAKETADSILSKKDKDKTEELKQEFEKFKIKQQGIADGEKIIQEANKKKAEEDEKRRKKDLDEIEKIDNKANEEKVKKQGEIDQITLDAISESNKKQTELERDLAYERLSLKQAIAEEEIRMNDEIINAKTLAEKEALQKSYQERLNAFIVEKTQESLRTQEGLQTRIEIDKQFTDLDKVRETEMKQAREKIEEVRKGELEGYKINLDDYKNLTEQQKSVLQDELNATEAYAATKINSDKMILTAQEGFNNTKNQLIKQLYNGEKIGAAQMKELLKGTVRDMLTTEGQRLAGLAITETVKGLVDLANPAMRANAPLHFSAAGQAAAGALALGVVSATMFSSSDSGGTTSGTTSGNTTGTGTGTTTTETKPEEQKEIHIHNTSLRGIAISLIPELESLAKDGYTKIVLEED